ncbi:MAG: Clp protease ClpP, partial [Candidatus Atribacteria bacterium]|nr:Clp protease ClpP [Candidatus Atribacteria bacterium]
MAKKIIRISGEIGFDTLAAAIVEQIASAGAEDLDIEIASPGGSVFDGLEIFNAIRAHKNAHPSAQIMITITGLAASMASYIAAVDVADMVAAYDNSVGMYHSPWNIAIGDFREMQKNADFLKGLSDLLAKAYVRKTGKPAAEIDDLLANETWLFGQELKDYGFVDEIIPSGDSQQSDKAAVISAAKLKFQTMQAHAKERKPDPAKVAALMQQIGATNAPHNNEDKTKKIPVVDGPKATPARGKEGKAVKDLKELQAEHPEIYAEAKVAFTAAGVKQEQD